MALAQGTPPEPLQESLQRTVISRLYYGLHTRRVAGTSERTPCLGHLGATAGTRICEIDSTETLNNIQNCRYSPARLKELREEADYQLAPPLRFRNRSMDARQFMDLAVEHSRQLLAALETYSPGEAEDGCDCPVVYASG